MSEVALLCVCALDVSQKCVELCAIPRRNSDPVTPTLFDQRENETTELEEAGACQLVIRSGEQESAAVIGVSILQEGVLVSLQIFLYRDVSKYRTTCNGALEFGIFMYYNAATF